jgi:putative DNA primase/helicase
MMPGDTLASGGDTHSHAGLPEPGEAAERPARFLQLVLPQLDGVQYCLVVKHDSGMWHYWCGTIEALAQAAVRASRNGYECWFACAGYGAKNERRAANAIAAAALWLDLDCGNDKPYADIRAAWAALADFHNATGLPPAVFVNSGGGVHLWWPFSKPLAKPQWLAAARLLKELCRLYDFKVDHKRTTDIASILRPPGTLNHKYDPPRPVLWNDDARSFDPDELIEKLQAAHDRVQARAPVDRSAVAANVRHPARDRDAEIARLEDALRYIPADDRDTWFTVGAGIHEAGWGETGFAVWDEWSCTSHKYNADDQLKTWMSFGRLYSGQRTTLASVYALAKQYGWTPAKAEGPTRVAPSPAPGARGLTTPAGGTLRASGAGARSDGASPSSTSAGPVPAPLAEGTTAADAPPATEPDLEAVEIARLAALPPLAYDRERKAAAKRLRCRESILDKLVAKERPRPDDELQGQPLDLPSPEPWPEPVEGDAVLDEIAMLLTKYVVMARHAADASALWILHTHLLDAAQAAPRFVIKSPEKRCGKTTLLALIGRLVPRPLLASNISPAAMFRSIDAAHPTLLIDEADTFIALKKGASPTPAAEELRGIFNSGHTRATAYVVKVVGEEYEPRKFSTWASIALALIGNLPGTMEDRSIIIPLRRRLQLEKVVRYREDRDEGIRDIASRAAGWAAGHAAQIGDRDPDVPERLNDRAADNWRPLLAIADEAGGDWPERAQEAAIALSADGAADAESTGVRLLADIKAHFETTGLDKATSGELVSYLVALEGRPWAEWGRSGKEITKNQLAGLLRKFKIRPGDIRFASGRVLKGYLLADFEDAFARYLDTNTDTQAPP